MDERYKNHRLRSTSIAAFVTALFVAGWFYYDFFVNDISNWQFVIILTVMAITKLSVMFFYRIKN